MPSSSSLGMDQDRIWIEKAKGHFRRGEYGLAERYFRQAVEERSKNVEAWLGLAATCDHLKRFDEAERAYDVISKLGGNSATVLNNLGYHYMLKGDWAKAEQILRTAEAQDPKNPFVQNNLKTLERWRASGGTRG